MLLVGLLLGLLVGPASCTNDDDPPDDPTPTTEPPESEVEAAYLAYWEMGARLLEAPDPDDPEIGTRATGDARDNLVAGLDALVEANQRSELGSRYSHDVVDVRVEDDDHAVVEDCAVDDSRLVDADTNEEVASGLVTELLSVRMVRVDGAWLVEDSSRSGAWEGETQCDR